MKSESKKFLWTYNRHIETLDFNKSAHVSKEGDICNLIKSKMHCSQDCCTLQQRLSVNNAFERPSANATDLQAKLVMANQAKEKKENKSISHGAMLNVCYY